MTQHLASRPERGDSSIETLIIGVGMIMLLGVAVAAIGYGEAGQRADHAAEHAMEAVLVELGELRADPGFPANVPAQIAANSPPGRRWHTAAETAYDNEMGGWCSSIGITVNVTGTGRMRGGSEVLAVTVEHRCVYELSGFLGGAWSRAIEGEVSRTPLWLVP